MMAFDPGLKVGDVLNNQKLCRVFECGNQGGMRRSRWTDSLVLISDHTKSLYHDRWLDQTLHYTGMGRIGDQSLDRTQNRTLHKSSKSGVSVFLFEVFEHGKYVYRGRVRLVGEPYQEDQPDAEGDLRKVWVFPLELVESAPPRMISEEEFEKNWRKREKVASPLSYQELAKRAREAPARPRKRGVASDQYERSEYVAELAKRNADGVCQLCEEPAPFKTRRGRPYLEIHHIVWLSRGGVDSISNTVALCPNCHRKMHALNWAKDKKLLGNKAAEASSKLATS